MFDKIDILNRQPFVDNLITLIHMLAERKKGCTFAIDGKWGSGKSFVLEMLEKQLSIYQDPNAAGDKYVIFHYNCWQYDFYEEPAVAIVAAIRSELSRYEQILPQLPPTISASLKVAGEVGKELLSGYMKNKFGFDPVNWIDRIKDEKDSSEEHIASENKFDTYYEFKKVLDITKQQLSQIALDKPVILIVDELDRCTPEYAIKILERLHHLFDEDSNIIVILAIDREQLNRTILQIFGSSSNCDIDMICSNYLKKFIHFTLSLDMGTITDEYQAKYAHIFKHFDIPEETVDFINSLTINLFKNIDMRTIELSFDRMFMLHQLAFGTLNCPAILIFEMLYQAILIQFPQCDDFDWLIVINKQQYPDIRRKFDPEFYEYLLKLKKSADTGSRRTFHSVEVQKTADVLYDSDIGIAFWMFVCLNDNVDSSGICNGFSIQKEKNYPELVIGARRYHAFSQLITQ